MTVPVATRTANDVVQMALDLLGVTAGGETVGGMDGNLALRRLNTLLKSFNTGGGLSELGDKWLEGGDPVPLEPSLMHGLSALLAESIAPAFGFDGATKPIPVSIIRDARDGRNAIQAATGPDPHAEIDRALTYPLATPWNYW